MLWRYYINEIGAVKLTSEDEEIADGVKIETANPSHAEIELQSRAAVTIHSVLRISKQDFNAAKVVTTIIASFSRHRTARKASTEGKDGLGERSHRVHGRYLQRATAIAYVSLINITYIMI